MVRIGLTGNIACGKSTVAGLLAEKGALVIDADQVAHCLMQPGAEVYQRVVSHFGSSIVGATGEIDRARLGSVVFSSPSALAELDALVHPSVVKQVDEMVAAASLSLPAVVVEAVKLIEAGMAGACHSVWVVACSPEVQIRRLMRTRGLNLDQARARLTAQGPLEAKLARADVVICNDAGLDHLRSQVEAAWWATLEKAGACASEGKVGNGARGMEGG